MRNSGGERAPLVRWQQVLFRTQFVTASFFASSVQAATGATGAGGVDVQRLLVLGITLGLIAFAVGTAIICLRAAERARQARAEAILEAEQLRASERTLELILAAEPDTLLTLTEGGSVRLLATNLPPSLGVPTEAAPLLRFTDWLDEASACELEEALDALSERGTAFNLALRTKRDKPVEANGRTAGGAMTLRFRDADGLADKYEALDAETGTPAAQLAAQDGAEERSAPEKGPSVETRFRSFDRLATAFAVFDENERLTHFNQAYVDLWQLDPAWLATHPRDNDVLDRLRRDRRLPEQADYRSWKQNWLAAYGSNRQVEDEWHLPDGRTLHVIADATPEGGVTYLYENVTEQLALESRYNAMIRVQRETLDTLREGVAVFGSNGSLKLCNSAFAALWRLNPQELECEPHIDEIIAKCRVLYDNAVEWELTKAAVTDIVPERRAYESEFDRTDGSVIACAALPLPDGGTLLTYHDITDAKRVERALIERSEALEAADRLKSAFISHISYELRTPLTNIIGFAEMLAEPIFGALTQKQGEYVGDILSSGETLRSIIDDILDLATIEAGSFELKLSPVKVREVVGGAVIGVRERLKQTDLGLEIDLDPKVDEFVADGRRVTQILYNLLSNAISFSPPGETIVLGCRPEDDMLAFTVEDRGCGIPEEYQPSVFERFESRSRGSHHGGAGLGLSIVKRLVELHGGTVSLASTPGRGTSVKVSLPLRHVTSLAEPHMQPEEPHYRSSRAG